MYSLYKQQIERLNVLCFSFTPILRAKKKRKEKKNESYEILEFRKAIDSISRITRAWLIIIVSHIISVPRTFVQERHNFFFLYTEPDLGM